MLKGKIGKQIIQNRLKFMDGITEDWIGMDLTDDVIRRLLKKKAYFKSYN